MLRALTLLKPLRSENRYKYICSGSLLGVSLRKAISIPMGSIIEKHMYPLDFEEFLWANNVGSEVIEHMKDCFINKTSLEDNTHHIGLMKNNIEVELHFNMFDPDCDKSWIKLFNNPFELCNNVDSSLYEFTP